MKQIRPVKDCPYCGEVTLITDSRSRDYGIWRRRICPKCHYKFTTVEVDSEMFMGLEKKSIEAVRIINKIRTLAKALED